MYKKKEKFPDLRLAAGLMELKTEISTDNIELNFNLKKLNLFSERSHTTNPHKFLWVGVCARKYKEILSFSFETSKLTMKKKKEKKKKMKVAEVG